MFKLLLSGLAAIVLSVSFGIGGAFAGPVLTPGSIDKLMDSQSVNKSLIKVSGCHANRRFHMVYKWGYKAWHRHRPNCRPIHTAAPLRHCHRNFRRHYHAGRGKRWHRHAGPGCYYQRGFVRRGPASGACVRIGGVRICAN